MRMRDPGRFLSAAADNRAISGDERQCLTQPHVDKNCVRLLREHMLDIGSCSVDGPLKP